MKKNKVLITSDSPTKTEILKASFKTTGELPSPEVIGKTVERVMSELKQQPKEETPERNKRKRETAKGTILQAVMIEKELLKKVKHSAFYNEKSISEVINQALRLFFD